MQKVHRSSHDVKLQQIETASGSYFDHRLTVKFHIDSSKLLMQRE